MGFTFFTMAYILAAAEIIKVAMARRPGKTAEIQEPRPVPRYRRVRIYRGIDLEETDLRKEA